MLSKRTYNFDSTTRHLPRVRAAERGAVRPPFFAAATGRALPIVLTFAVLVTPAAAAPPTLRDYLRACGIGADDFGRFRDDRQMADEELDVVRRIAVRLRDCPADSLRQMIAKEPAQLDSPQDSQRGRSMRLHGSIETIGQAAESLCRCTIASDTRPHHVVVYVVGQTGDPLHVGEGVTADSVFVKFVPGVKDQPLPVFVAPRLQPRAAGPLGDLDFDAGLLDGIWDNAPLTGADSAAFWRLLLLAKTADPGRLLREATVLDASIAARLFANPTGQRGRLLRVSGIARRVVQAPIDDPATAARLGTDHYYQIDLLSDALQDNPLIFCTLELPTGGDGPDFRRAPETLTRTKSSGENGTVPIAIATGQPVEVTGFFLKTWQFPTRMTAAERADCPGVSQLLQTAPLLIGPQPRWEPASTVKNRLPGAVGGFLVVLGISGLGLLLWHVRQTDQEFSLHVRRAFQPDKPERSGGPCEPGARA